MNSRMFRSLTSYCISLAVILFAFVTPQAQTKKPVPIYDPAHHKANVKTLPKSRFISPMDTTSSGSSCTLVTFEGLGDQAAIPDFYGISLPDWLSIIEDSVGGTGNFANEPSPVTIAFWLEGNPTSQSINIPNGASQISLYYSSAYAITLSAYDAKGNLLTTMNGDENFDSTTDVYDVWSPLTVNAPSGTSIASLSVTGYANYTAIDNLNVCQSPQIASVEVTQAIQQYQTLADLKTSLASGGKPPVPIVADKPAVLRAYFNPVQSVTNLKLNLSGVSSATKDLALQPNCAPADQRALANGCQSIDFYFTPPSGSWTATLDLVDASGNKLEEESLPFTSVSTDSMRVRGVAVCDSTDLNGQWQCGTAADLLSDTDLLAEIAPTASLTTDITTNQIKRDINDTTTYPVTQDPPYKFAWWHSAAAGVDGLFGLFDWAGDFLFGRRTTYFGMIRNDKAPNYFGGLSGIADNIPSHGAISLSVGTWGNLNLIPSTVAHEVGHTLGGKHTNTANPAINPVDGPPGCWSLAPDPSTYWPYTDNYIQTGAVGSSTYEVPFNVSAQSPFAPQSKFEIMGYCSPSWISTQSYLVWMNTLGGGSSSSAIHAEHSAVPAVGTSSTQPFWQVSGSISGSGATFDPLFQVTVQGDTGTDSGTYSLQVRNGTGTVLFTRLFTPTVQVSENGPTSAGIGTSDENPAVFSQLIPVTVGAATIVLLDPTNTEIGRIMLAGTAPTVTITSPTARSVLSGTQPVIWTVSGPPTFYSKTLYSSDKGTTWSVVSETTNKSQDQINFDLLPGSTQALIQVLVSDGVNSASATSAAFTVPKKKPSVAVISTPANNSAQPAANPVSLSGAIYDVDDGVLSGTALQWTDNAAGSLGSGSPLSVTLKPGSHTITLTGTDSDGNTISATTNLLLGGQPPIIGLTGQALNEAPTTCEFATVSATPGNDGGAPLSQVQYSVDGGSNYTTILLESLPYGFLVPGSGFIHIVARAYDVSGQSNAQDATFFIQSACSLATQSISFNALTNQAYGASPIPLNATASSGLPVSYSVSGPAAVSASTLTITGVGTVTVTATQPGNATYAPAAWVSHSFTVVPATPIITLSSNANSAFAQSAVTLTAAVASVGGVPTGTVNFLDGSASIGSSTVTNGMATFTTSSLSIGSHTITSVYSGDSDFVSVTSGALTQNIEDFSLAVSTGSTSITVERGSPASYALNVAPVGATSTPAVITLSATGLPAGASVSFSPASVPTGSSSTDITMKVNTSSTADARELRPFGSGTIPLVLSILILPFSRRVRLLSRRLSKSLSVATLLISGILIVTAFTGCGGGKPKTQSQPQSYTITVTAASGSLSHSTTVTLTVE